MSGLGVKPGLPLGAARPFPPNAELPVPGISLGKRFQSRFHYLCTWAQQSHMISYCRYLGQGHFGVAARRPNAPDDIGRPFNNLLRRLSASDFGLIASHLAREVAKPNDLLYNLGDDAEIVHVPRE